MHVLLFETIAFVGATVHTMAPAAEGSADLAPASRQIVLVEDGFIKAVGPDLEIPEGARTIDITGLHIAPGLIDTAVSFDAEHDALYLSAGVTLVRDTGSPTGSMLKERTLSMRQRNPGPSLHVTSPVFASNITERADAFALGPPLQAAEQIKEILGLVSKDGTRIQSFTFEDTVTPDQHALICVTANEYGVDAWGPIPGRLRVRDAAKNGQHVLLGLDSLLEPGQRFETLPNEEDSGGWLGDLSDTTAAIGEGNWTVVPLLMGTARIIRSAALDGDPPVLAALGPLYTTAWRVDLETFKIMKARGESYDRASLSLERQRSFAMALRAAGAQLVPGTGAPSGGIAPGSGLIDELGEWVVGGVTPTEALYAATRGAAEAIGEGGKRGLIAPGFIADMIVLGSDPTVSIEALRSPEIVVVRGAVRERFELDEAVAALIATQIAATNKRNAVIALTPPPMPEGTVVLDDRADHVSYGTRTATERFQVVKTDDGAMAYGARIRVIPTATAPERELVLVQVLRGGIVERFDLTLDVLDQAGEPQRDENGASAFFARGVLVGETKKLSIERRRFGDRIDSKRAQETISLIEGSGILPALISAMHGVEGEGYALQFDPEFMEPVVDKVQFAVSEVDQRLTLQNSRGVRVFGVGAKGEFLFGATAESGGRLDFNPTDGTNDPVLALEVPAGRRFTGDPEHWNDPTSAAEARATTGTKGDDGK